MTLVHASPMDLDVASDPDQTVVGWCERGSVAIEQASNIADRPGLHIPGLCDVSGEVVVLDGSGRRRRTPARLATADDLRSDLELQHRNLAAAQAAIVAAEARNVFLLPLMEDKGFATAGEAIEHLSASPPPEAPVS